MHLAGPTPWIAPLATGHPLGLPALQKQPQAQIKVQPAHAARGMGTMMSDRQPPPHSSPARRDTPDPATHVAPPTIMQIKISQMLDDQAVQLRDPAETGEGTSEPEASEARPDALRDDPATAARRGYEAIEDLRPDAPPQTERAPSPVEPRREPEPAA